MHIARWRPFSLLVALLLANGLVLAGCTGGNPKRSSDQATLSVLTCRDSAGQQGFNGPPARLVNGVNGFIGDSQYLPLDPQVVHGQHYQAWKAALAVAPDAGPYRTVSVVSPASARLDYGGPVSRRVRLPACGHRYALFVGGIYVAHPACVILRVTGPSVKPETVAVPVMVGKC